MVELIVVPIPVEITYGIERLCMFIQEVDNVFELTWQETHQQTTTYGDVYKQFETEHCHYNFTHASVERLFQLFDLYEQEADTVLTEGFAFPAYEYCLKCSHTFNLLDARSAISVTERTGYILRIRKLAQRCAFI